MFLSMEVPDWFRNNACYSCHNNGDGVRALYLALHKGLKVPFKALEDTTAWLSKPSRWSENKGDPAFSDKRLANIQFAAALVEAGFMSAVQPAAWVLTTHKARMARVKATRAAMCFIVTLLFDSRRNIHWVRRVDASG
jgi:hypothetical protein